MLRDISGAGELLVMVWAAPDGKRAQSMDSCVWGREGWWWPLLATNPRKNLEHCSGVGSQTSHAALERKAKECEGGWGQP